MRSPGCRREKYCHNGGMTLAHHYGASREGVPARGSAIAIVVPVVVPDKVPICREMPQSSGSVLFGGSAALIWLLS
jgi:hypothetical protein